MAVAEAGTPSPIFIGDHLAMDFLNTSATPSGVRTEWLAGGADLVDWLEEAGAIDSAVAAKFRAARNSRVSLDRLAGKARALREWLRSFVERHAGRPLGAEALGELTPLNRVLVRDDSYGQIEAGAWEAQDGAHIRHLCLKRIRRWGSPEQLLQPLAEAIADLICREDFRFVRACEGSACTLMFLDRTKAHARRWCSMAACGNRAKAAAHRARARSGGR